MSESQCVVCNKIAEVRHNNQARTVHFDCKQCGAFQMTAFLTEHLRREDNYGSLRLYLSAYLRQATERQESPMLDTKNWEELAARHRTSIPQKMEKLLRMLGHRSKTGGEHIQLNDDDLPLFDAIKRDEASYLVRSLCEVDLVREVLGSDGYYEVSPKGWDRLAPSQPGGIPGTCFVAMSFDDELKPAFTEGILPALTACGFQAIRLDTVEHNENINDKIIAELRSAQFTIADFSQHKGGVYFEAGYALGMDRIVIWTCRKSDFEARHFDTHPYNHIVWEEPYELKEKLIVRIRATPSLDRSR
jgi:hypothetical protein